MAAPVRPSATRRRRAAAKLASVTRVPDPLPSTTSPSFDALLALARKYRLAVEWGELRGNLGLYDLRVRRILLDVSLRVDPILARATLAHEVGHHMTRRYARDPARWEYEAQAWARRLLIPEAEALAAWREAVQALVGLYGVPASWAAARLLEVVM